MGFFQLYTDSKLRFLWVFLFILLAFKTSYAATDAPQGLLEKAFYIRDIDQLVGRLIKSPSFKNVNEISQKFTSSCSNMNRIILPFWIENDSSKNKLDFSLQDENGKTVFSKLVSSENWTSQKQIGTHATKGILHYIWFQPQKDSKNKIYQWVLTPKDSVNSSMGIFLTKEIQSRVDAIKINQKIMKKKVSAFHSYCQYQIDLDNILSIGLERALREKYFLSIYLIVLLTICFFIFKKNKILPVSDKN